MSQGHTGAGPIPPGEGLVTITSALPHAQVEHAGGKYLNILFDALGRSAITVLAPPFPSVLRALTLPGHPPRTVIAQPVSGWLHQIEMHLRRLDPGMPPWSLVAALVTDSRFARELQAARVVDLQWQDCIRVVRLVRRRAPHARIVGTFHDVQSQKFDRLAKGATGRRRIKWRTAAMIARHVEKSACRELDEVVVFSTKDAALLPAPRVTVVDPPLCLGAPALHRPAERSRVCFVAFFSRPENHEAARWLLTKVWPRVLDSTPHAQLDLVGAGADSDLVELAAASPNVSLHGFVPDLAAVLGQAAVAVAPLFDGAGVKFKTVEALLAGVPVVTTPIGAEGIQPLDQFWAVTGVADDFAAAIVSALREPERAQELADQAQSAAAARYSVATFQRKVDTLYGREIDSVGSHL